ncbi:hypothetical protein FAIPA1_260026 [Frankia sp. AiPs1]
MRHRRLLREETLAPVLAGPDAWWAAEQAAANVLDVFVEGVVGLSGERGLPPAIQSGPSPGWTQTWELMAAVSSILRLAVPSLNPCRLAWPGGCRAG